MFSFFYFKKFFAIAVIAVFVFISFFSFVVAGLDYDYPDVPGTDVAGKGGLNITSDSSLGDAIKYFASWAIIIGAIVAFLSLIYAGFLYVSSTGDASAKKEANDKIRKSFLGLLILTASYLIMMTLNPQLAVLKLEKTAINQGIVLLTVVGESDLNNATNGKSVEQLITDGEAIYLPVRMADAQSYKLWNSETAFGSFESTKKNPSTGAESCKVTEVNFSNFKLAYIGFLPGSENVKVVAYGEKNFKGERDKIKTYTSAGKLKDDGLVDIMNSSDTINVNGVSLSLVSVSSTDFQSEVEYVDKDTKLLQGSCTLLGKEKKGVPHPPLSFEIRDMLPGVYLYADKPGEEVYLNKDEDFRKSNTDFNDEVKRIEIRNEDSSGADHDYIAVLHQDDNYTGNLKVFFEKKNRKIVVGDPNGDSSDGNLDVWQRFFVDVTLVGSVFREYGYMGQKEASSVHVREINSDDPLVCKSVWLCTGEDWTGECLVYLNQAIKRPDFEEHRWIGYAPFVGWTTSSIPRYTPVNLTTAEEWYVVKKLGLDAGGSPIKTKEASENWAGVDGLPTSESMAVAKSKMAKFEDKIKSLWIEGDCMVVLFENKVGGSNFPGSHSQVFFESQKSLVPYQIHGCKPYFGLAFWKAESCVSAIAIYPIKR